MELSQVLGEQGSWRTQGISSASTDASRGRPHLKQFRSPGSVQRGTLYFELAIRRQTLWWACVATYTLRFSQSSTSRDTRSTYTSGFSMLTNTTRPSSPAWTTAHSPPSPRTAMRAIVAPSHRHGRSATWSSETGPVPAPDEGEKLTSSRADEAVGTIRMDESCGWKRMSGLIV